jgi:hypothetical protein
MGHDTAGLPGRRGFSVAAIRRESLTSSVETLQREDCTLPAVLVFVMRGGYLLERGELLRS